MKPKSFTYLRPASIDEAVQALARWREDARILAGGQSLVAMMNFRLIEAQVLIDVSDLAPLAYIRESNGEIEVGASTTQAQFMTWPKLAERAPLLNAAMPHVGHYRPFRSEFRVAAVPRHPRRQRCHDIVTRHTRAVVRRFPNRHADDRPTTR